MAVFEALPALASQASAAPAAPQPVVVMSGLVALVLSLIVWPVVGFAVVLAHEGGHAVTASMMGGTVKSIHMYGKNDSRGRGLTRATGLGPVGGLLMLLGGSLGPSIFGLGGAVLLTGGHSDAVLWISLVFLLLALLQMKNVIGGMVAVATGAVIFLVLRYGSPDGRTFFAYTWVWFLLFGGFGHVVASHWHRGDAGTLKQKTWVPVMLWSAFFGMATLAALGYGAGILLNIVHPGR